MKIHRNAIFVTWVCGIPFIPGDNTITNAQYKRLKGNRSFKHEIQMGRLTIVVPKVEPVEYIGPGMTDWRKFIQVIKETDDLELLAEWSTKEVRVGCVKAIQFRLTELGKTQAKDEPKDKTPPAEEPNATKGDPPIVVGGKPVTIPPEP